VAIEDSKVTTRDEAESSPGEPKEKENSEDAAFRSLAVAFAGLARAFLLGLGKFGFTKGALRIALKKRAFFDDRQPYSVVWRIASSSSFRRWVQTEAAFK
jgi:hypothetical protein